jgi:hypothetical protein
MNSKEYEIKNIQSHSGNKDNNFSEEFLFHNYNASMLTWGTQQPAVQ